MTLRVTWSPDADADLLDIWDHLVRTSSVAVADEQLVRIFTVSSRLSEWPRSGRPRDSIIPGMRSLVVNPYLVFYRLGSGGVQIVRVLHGRRDIDAVFDET